MAMEVLEPRRHEILYFPDGNVIINVDGTHFRLFRSRLERQCKHLQSLFKHNGQSPDVQESLEGYPVYTLSNLALSDFEMLLKFLEFPL